ncbi:glycine betaine ABC transporter substrate-binding protein [Tsukamurella pseudospumae]|uniref:glycine betaine ABC transporter substrate-binding protein n=1 Tax=Tsukamurella pseudospumae TaxID=239498 RepID=UPI0009EF1249|nr:glycine betaine ABC transporter substrate-binding protein [Tsukamurella pseudospumae]
MRCRKVGAAVVTLVALGVAGCSDAGDLSDLGPRTAPGTVTVGSSDGAASRIGALLYANALRAAGTPVQTELGLGPGDAAVAAVERGDITIAPALTGELWERYRPGVAQPTKAKESESENPREQWDAQFVALSAVLPEGLGLGDPTLALDQPMLFVSKDAPAATLRGCEGLSGTVAIPSGSPSDLKARYGCPTGPVVVVPDEVAAARAVTEGRASIAQLGTLSPSARDLTQVADPDGAVPSRAVVPLVRRDGLTVAQTKRLSAIAGELTTADLAQMVAKVESGERTAEQAADDWAKEHPLH